MFTKDKKNININITIKVVDIVVLIVTFLLFYAATMPPRIWLSIATVTEVRVSAVLNPVFGLAFGWAAAIGCALANFVADIACGYGIKVALEGFIPQIIYGILPYYLWKAIVPFETHRTRLNTPRLVILYAIVMAINSIIIGIFVGLIELSMTNKGFLNTAIFACLNDFNVCMILGLPLMSLLDFMYSKIKHHGKRKLSANEGVIFYTMLIQIIGFYFIMRYFYKINVGQSNISIWGNIYRYGLYYINIVMILSVCIMFLVAYINYKHRKLMIFEKKNGTLFVDQVKMLEFVSTPKSENRDLYKENWYVMLTNQKGCPMRCKFCDAPAFGYHGNVTRDELSYQINTIIDTIKIKKTNRLEVDFMRMGEPSFNPEILKFIEHDLVDTIKSKLNVNIVYPFISTMLPRANENTKKFILEYCRIKNEVYEGNAEIQFSMNSTDDDLRNNMFNNLSLSLVDIADIGKSMPEPVGAKYALNFAVASNSIIDARKIDYLFDKKKFKIKLTPIHETFNAVDHGYYTNKVYGETDRFNSIVNEFDNLGWDVDLYLDTKGEDDDDLTCGKLVLSHI